MTLADAAPPPAASTSGGSKTGSTPPGSKAGTFVSTGNRLLDKLQRDKVGREREGVWTHSGPLPVGAPGFLCALRLLRVLSGPLSSLIFIIL